MNTVLRGSCLALYALALASFFIELPSGIAPVIRYGALIMLAGHVLEVFVAYKSIRLYRGTLMASVALTLLFGFLHWLPLARAKAGAPK